MKHRFFKITRKEIKVYDADTSIAELSWEVGTNFLWGFSANVVTPFIASRMDWAVGISFFWYYFLISYVLNRDKYETKLGKYLVMPVSAAIGAYASYKVGYAIIDWLK